ncbi:hypothetical protein Isop_1670 [Isosphaera pallida ATCC 43644]|uniref:Uncharacterized protein n=1 Tax=Isosphaera pallida (strain ATCC 43644 / DSM 9630 / IS1B) TaxID=575540 RepID=E8R0C7_ISOPI|nr:hypothetical protein [Isosphaera pallida]ADV62254.1 hypothetical protein Isop_1670 [Isosphaera pallida ATCC 43644]
MFVRLFSGLVVVLGMFVAGCGGNSGPVEVKKFDTLTEEQKKAIQAEDAQIDEEESTAGGVVPKKGR